MLFTDKIFKKKIDDSVHESLIRFGKGTFENRALLKITVSKTNLKLAASYDLVKDLTIAIAEYADKIEVKGKVMKGKKKEEIDEEMTGTQLKKLCEENTFILLNLEFGEYSLKVGKSLPKPGKELKNNFCKCVLPVEILDKLTELKDFKKLEISNTFKIDDIIVPDEHKEDFEQARLNAKRKGILIRKTILDKKESEEKSEFEA